MGKPLRVLMVEDSEDDVLLTIRALKKGGYDPVYERVETAEAIKIHAQAGYDIRPTLGIDSALEEIEKNRGTLYDTGAVDACLRLFREKRYKLE
jgi:hypothetical protein